MQNFAWKISPLNPYLDLYITSLIYEKINSCNHVFHSLKLLLLPILIFLSLNRHHAHKEGYNSQDALCPADLRSQNSRQEEGEWKLVLSAVRTPFPGWVVKTGLSEERIWCWTIVWICVSLSWWKCNNDVFSKKKKRFFLRVMIVHKLGSD